MQLLLVFPAPLCAFLMTGRMAGWTQSRQEGWSLHLLKRPHRPLTDEGLAMPLPFTVLAALAASRSSIFGLKRTGVVGRGECEI